MAKRQQSGEFNPTQSIQPSQQITNQYITPSYFQMPQNEAIDIARSLASISPTLTELNDNLMKSAVDAQVAEGIGALETATEEELDAALGMKWREAGLPEGASPIAQKAILAHAGKMKAKSALEQFRIGNLDRFSDPMNTEDPREAMVEHFESLGITGFYATSAATEELAKQNNAFSEQVYQSRAARTAKQNRENMADDVYNMAKEFNPGMTLFERSELASRIGLLIQGNYEKYGFSGRDEAWRGISAAAKEIAEDDLEAANELINYMENLEIGGRTIEQQFGSEISALGEDLIEISERAEDREIRREDNARKRRNQLASDAASALWTELSENQTIDDFEVNSPEGIEVIRQKLIALGVPEDEVKNVAGDVATRLEKFQGLGDKDDDEAVASLYMMISGSASLEEIEAYAETRLNDGDLSPVTHAQIITRARKEKDIATDIRRAQFGDRDAMTRAIDELEASLSNLDKSVRNEIIVEYRNRYEEISREVVVNNPGDDEIILSQKIAAIREKELDAQYRQNLSPIASETLADPERRSAPTPSGASSATIKAFKSFRSDEAAERPMPPSLDPRKAPMLDWDSEFTDVQEDFEDAVEANDVKTMNRLRGRLYRLAQRQAASNPNNRGFAGKAFRRDVRDYKRAKSITGLSISEIVNRELEFGFELTEDLLDPKWVILFDGIETAEEFEALKQTEEGEKRINEVYDALPTNYKGTGDDFFNLQLTLFKRYR